MKIWGHIVGFIGLVTMICVLLVLATRKPNVDAGFLTQEQLNQVMTLSNANADLQNRYRDYNYEYFYYDLPENTVVMCGPHKLIHDKKRALAFTARSVDRHFIIVIDEIYCDSSAEYSKLLLHEMCHIRTWHQEEDHGPLFQAEIRRLIGLGAYNDLL